MYCTTILGISDHEAVLVSDIPAKVQPHMTGKIFLWWKANFNYIKEKVQLILFQIIPLIIPLTPYETF